MIPLILGVKMLHLCIAKQKHLERKKGEANQKQQLSDYGYIATYTCDQNL